MRLRFKCLAVIENKKSAVAFGQNEDCKSKHWSYYRKNHKKNLKEKRERKRIRKWKYKPQELDNDEMKVELLTRSLQLALIVW